MDILTYSVTTYMGRTIEATWTGRCIQIVVYGIYWSDIQVEWKFSVEAAAERFQALVEQYGKQVKETPQTPIFKSPETILHEKRKTNEMRDDWEEWQGGNFDLQDFY